MSIEGIKARWKMAELHTKRGRIMQRVDISPPEMEDTRRQV